MFLWLVLKSIGGFRIIKSATPSMITTFTELQMTQPILETNGFAAAVIDALASQLCVVDSDSKIVAVNRAWKIFGAENSASLNRSGVGIYYLDVCGCASGLGSDEAAPFAAGLRSVLEAKTELFQMEYPCHSPSENRWFLGRVTPLKVDQGGAVISHLNITARKVFEIALEKLASTDPLTGLPNRRFFMESGKQDLERVRRFAVPASLVKIDLDHFKAVNDTYGHAAGDEALRRVSQACRAALRPFDVLARLGGEEFAVVLPGADEEAATLAAERLRVVVRDMTIKTGQSQFSITASFGVTEMSPHDLKFDGCLSRADAALYRAKHAGRNCVQRFSPVRA
jgi:diguanylate cyclase (GGDEF)-like protein